jgi:hypothetical protein
MHGISSNARRQSLMENFLGAFAAEWERRKAAFLHDLSLGRGRFASASPISWEAE